MMNITKDEISQMITKELRFGRNFPYTIKLHKTFGIPLCRFCKETHTFLVIESFDKTTNLFRCSHANYSQGVSISPTIIHGKKLNHSPEVIQVILFQSLKNRGTDVKDARKGVDLSPYMKSNIVPIRVSTEELEILEEKAEDANCSIGEYIRRKVFKN